MNQVDHFAVDKLMKSDNEQLKEIGNMFYRFNGSITKEDMDKLAKLLSEIDDYLKELESKIEELEESL